MKYKAKLKINDKIATGYDCQVSERHFLILDDAELVNNNFFDRLIHGFVEIDPDTLEPVRTFGSTIAARRKHLRFSQEKLAHRAGISRNYVSQIERGEADNPSAKALFAVGEALGISDEELIRLWKESTQ